MLQRSSPRFIRIESVSFPPIADISNGASLEAVKFAQALVVFGLVIGQSTSSFAAPLKHGTSPSRSAHGRASRSSLKEVPFNRDLDDAVRSFVVDVKVQFGNEVLYDRPLHLAPGFVTTYTETLNETPALICKGPTRYHFRDKRMLRIQLSQWRNSSEPIHVVVELVRPAGLPGCGEAGTRTAKTDERTFLHPGQSVAFPGDGGLGVFLNRH